jgi:hypothetical protein
VTTAAKRPLSPVQRALQLDKRESAARLKEKTAAGKKRWGKNWRDMVRAGRRFTRVQTVDPITADGKVETILRPEPGWEWVCQNCKTYSLITGSMMPAILKDWEALAKKTVDRGYKPPVKPTAATAGCTNCKYLPGAPE